MFFFVSAVVMHVSFVMANYKKQTIEKNFLITSWLNLLSYPLIAN
jgi:hypothetical protein